MLLTLSYPPSMNTYYRTVGGRILISAKGRKYRKQAALEVLIQNGKVNLTERLSLSIVAYMPDKRKRDLDNLLKSTLDALQHAGVYEDDGQIDRLAIARDGQTKGGKLIIEIKAIKAEYRQKSKGLSDERD